MTMPPSHHRLLLTGAAGGLGQALRGRLKANCQVLRLSDVADLGQPQAGEEIVTADLANADAVQAMMAAETWLTADEAMLAVRFVPHGGDEHPVGLESLEGCQLGGSLMGETVSDTERQPGEAGA